MNIVDWLPRYYQALPHLAWLSPGARVLDIACGEGDMASHLGRSGAKVWAADLSEADLRKGLARNSGPGVSFIAADATALPFGAESFDCVVSFDTLDDIPDDAPAIAELARVLKRGGLLVVSVPARTPTAGDMFWEQRALRRWLPRCLYSRVRYLAGHSWLETTLDDLLQYRDYQPEGLPSKFPQFEVAGYDFAVKRFSALAMDISYGVRGFPRFGLKPYMYWLSTRLDSLFLRGPRHRGYTLIARLVKK